MTRCQRRRLVEKEQLGEPAGRHQRSAAPAAKGKPTRDPPLGCVAPEDLAFIIV